MTLTGAAILARKAAFWVAIVIVLFVFLRITVGVSTTIFRQFFPKPPPPPTVSFGKITPFDFSQNEIQDSGGVSYSLQTIGGDLPNLGDQGKVFKVIQTKPSIVFGEQARKQATRLKFAPEPQIQSERFYIFKDSENPARKLELDVISNNFKIANDIRYYPELLPLAGQLSKERAIQIAQSFLPQYELLQKDLKVEKTTVTPLRIEGSQLVTAKSLAETHIMRVVFGRSDLEKLPVLSVNSEKPNIWVEVAPLQNPEKQVFAASYIYYLPDLTMPATYPLKSTRQAYEEFVAGKGILVGAKSPQMAIRRVYLAYLETAAQMNFFAPVYVFAGDNFAGFVPAVSPEWIEP